MRIDVLDQPARPADRARWSTARVIVTVAILAALVASGLVVRGVLAARAAHPPYPASAISASVRMTMVTPERAQAAADRLAGPGRLSVPAPAPIEGWGATQQVVGQLTFRTPANAPSGGQYGLIVIDRASNRVVDHIYGAGPVGTHEVATSWDYHFNDVAAKYPWLHMIASQRTPDGSGFTDPGMALMFPPDTSGPITFAALLPKNSLPVTDPAQQVTVALVFVGANGHVYWATKLAG